MRRDPDLKAWKHLQVETKLPSCLFIVICNMGIIVRLGTPCRLNVSTVTHSLQVWKLRQIPTTLGCSPEAHSKGKVLSQETAQLSPLL